MGETKLGCVQRLAMKLQFFQYLILRLSRTAVDRIAEQGVADRSHVDADLMGPPGFEPAFDQRSPLEEVEPSPVGHRALAALAFDDGDLLAVGRRTGERCVDRACRRLWNAVDDRQIAAVDRMRAELLREAL